MEDFEESIEESKKEEEEKERYLLQGYFSNENEDYEINNLSDVEISIYDQNGDFIVSVGLKDEYMEEIVIPAEDITLYEFYLPENIQKNDYSFENFSTTLSCNYHYSEAQEKEGNQDGTVSSYTPGYQYDYYDYSTQSRSGMETDCSLCTNGKVICVKAAKEAVSRSVLDVGARERYENSLPELLQFGKSTLYTRGKSMKFLKRFFFKRKEDISNKEEISIAPKTVEQKQIQTQEKPPIQEVKPTEPCLNLGEGYYLTYQETGNGYGGFCRVNACLYKGQELIQRMTDERGYFLEFPGVEHGEWEKNLIFPFEPVTRFPFSYNRFQEDGLAEFFWMVQPDGRYWEDEDGFGAEKNIEIELLAKFDKNGKFVTKFQEKKK